jgi:hypothetical protein
MDILYSSGNAFDLGITRNWFDLEDPYLSIMENSNR